MLNCKIGLGTAQFGLNYGINNASGQTHPEEVSRILQFASLHGINMLDTASAYGNAEEVLGKNNLSSFNIVSKYITPSVAGSINDQLQHTLMHLGIKNLYGYLAHRPTEIIDNKEQWKVLKQLQEKGLIKKVGFSLNSPEELTVLIKKSFIPDIIQVPYNYADNRFESFMIELKEKGCEVHARSVFMQGLFFRDVNNLPTFFDLIKPVIKYVQTQTKNISAALLHAVASKHFIDKVIVGVENVMQLQINLTGLETAVELGPVNVKLPEQILMPSNWPKK